MSPTCWIFTLTSNFPRNYRNRYFSSIGTLSGMGFAILPDDMPAIVALCCRRKQIGCHHSQGGPVLSLDNCAKVCLDCQLECDACFSHCVSQMASGSSEHAATVQLCADYAECCKACATLCARQSRLDEYMRVCCANCCEMCAQACERFKTDEYMLTCAQSLS